MNGKQRKLRTKIELHGKVPGSKKILPFNTVLFSFG